MAKGILRALLGMSATFLAAAPLSGQVGVVIHGRVEDASSREPIAGARVSSDNSSAVHFTDSGGAFAIVIDAGESFTVYVEQYGYLSQRFDLPDEAPSNISVLLLEPDPIELDGINVTAESSVTELFRELRSRRNSYEGSVMAFDRAQLGRFAPVGTAWDFISQRVSDLFECSDARSGLCRSGRGRSFQNPNPEVPVLVCVDGWESWGAISELANLDIQSVALIEVYGRGRGGIRVYTGWYLSSLARTGRLMATPLAWGC
jgi:hypothetical protein